MNEIKINKQEKSITIINNEIAFSQFGIAKEILDLIEDLQQRVEQLEKENEQLRTELNTKDNIINELEKYIKSEIPEEEFVNSEWYVNILDKLKELKENK